MLLLTRLVQLGFIAASVLLIAGCAGGSALSANSVARVGDSEVSKEVFASYNRVVNRFDSNVYTPKGEWVNLRLDSDNLDSCVRGLGRYANEDLGSSLSGKDELLKNCRGRLVNNREIAIAMLIGSTWAIESSKRLDVEPSSEEVNQETENQLANIKDLSNLSEKELLGELTLGDLRLIVKSQLAAQAVEGQLSTLSDQNLEQYYNQNKDNIFNGISLDQARAMIKDENNVVNVTTNEQLANQVKKNTLCDKDYLIALCSNGPDIAAKTFISLPPSLLSILYPQASRSGLDAKTALGEVVITDDKSSPGDGGAFAENMPDRLPRDTAKQNQIWEEDMNEVPQSGGAGQ